MVSVMASKYMRAAILAAVAAGPLAGCGLEGAVVEALGDENILPASRIGGTVTNQPTAMRYTRPDGEEVAPIEGPDFSGERFSVALPSDSYTNGRLEAIRGEQVLSTLIPTMSPESAIDGVALDASSTASTLIVDGTLSASSRTLSNTEPREVAELFNEMEAAFAQPGPEQDLAQMVDRLIAAGDPSGSMTIFNRPSFDAEFNATSPTLNADWLAARQVDYDGDGAPDTDSAAFDATLGLIIQGQLSDPICYDPDLIRVVFEVNFNAGQLDGNCDSINRFRWVQDGENKRMYFVGGVHEESPIQDPFIDALMGNTGSWTPNTIAMYDDGTNGDEVAGDNIWTKAFAMPRGIRLGYKYTWGEQGQLWTGTEEWPGNQRILEVVDVNGDEFVRRRDNFGDEATNKDLSNLGRSSGGSVTWESDHNGDDIPDAQERPLDLDGDCSLDDWVTPTAVPPLTVPCEE